MRTNTIVKDAAKLHQDLYAYGKLKTQEKLLLVSGILIALSHGFSIDFMSNSKEKTDGELLYHAIYQVMEQIEMDEKSGKAIILEQFTFLKNTKILNKNNPVLKMTPLKYFTIFLKEKIVDENIHASEDYIGQFYSEFMSYESSEGQTLGIILTPSHISSLFADLLHISKDDIILDPCAGTGGFLIAGLHHELSDQNGTAEEIYNEHLYGFEVQHFMFTIASLNLIIRGSKKIHLRNQDFLEQNEDMIQKSTQATVGMINPPYALGTRENPRLYEISFVKHLLDSMTVGGRVAAIIPTSSMTGKTKDVRNYKKDILKNHTLEGVITMNPNTFYGVDTQTAIAVFTAGIPHPKNKQSKFVDFRNDGYIVVPHEGLLPTDKVKEKRNLLLNVWNGYVTSENSFCIETTVKSTDEWLHSFFYHREEIPCKEVFERKANDYLKFRWNSIIDGKDYLFDGQRSFSNLNDYSRLPSLDKKKWKSFRVDEIFYIKGTKPTEPKKLVAGGTIPRVCCSSINNGIENTYQNEATEEGNVLTIESASVGSIHYQQVPFSSSSHVEKLELRGAQLDVFIGLFLVATFSDAIKDKYNYGYKISKSRMKDQRIMLPVNEVGDPDYLYMQTYMMGLIHNQWKRTIDKF